MKTKTIEGISGWEGINRPCPKGHYSVYSIFEHKNGALVGVDFCMRCYRIVGKEQL